MPYLLKLAVVALVTVPLALVAIVLGLFDRHGKRVYCIGRIWSRLILRIAGVSLRVSGLEALDPARTYVFMVNHQSNLDIPVLVDALSAFQLRWLAKKELLWVPLFGWAMWASKHIVVDRSDALHALKGLRRAKDKLAAGISVVIFPEGTRSRDGKLLRFKKGGFLLAAQARTPVVPVTINGSGAVLPAGAWRLRAGRIDVTVGESVPVEGHRPENLKLLSQEVRRRIAQNLQSPAASECDVRPGAERSLRGERRLENEVWNR